MKTLKFDHDNFALSTTVLGIMQANYHLIQAISKVLGNRFVISGCSETAGVISAGVDCIDGEVMETDGGPLATPCKVESNTVVKQNQDGSYQYDEKKLVFTAGGEFGFNTVKNLGDLINNVDNLLTEVESIDDRTSAVETQVATLAKHTDVVIDVVSSAADVTNLNYSRINRAGNIYAIQASFDVAFGTSAANEELEFSVGIPDALDEAEVNVEIDGVSKAMTISGNTPLRLRFSDIYNQETIEVVINTIILG